jgi:2-Cys peroxiredoxin 5
MVAVRELRGYRVGSAALDVAGEVATHDTLDPCNAMFGESQCQSRAGSCSYCARFSVPSALSCVICGFCGPWAPPFTPVYSRCVVAGVAGLLRVSCAPLRLTQARSSSPPAPPFNIGSPSLAWLPSLAGGAVNIAELAKGKKLVIFGVPGSFTPGCSATHLPGYIQKAAEIKGKGVSEIVCVSVNDAFVHAAWGKAQGADGKVRMLADPNAELTKALGLDVELKVLGGVRSKRYSAIVEDGEIKALNVEPDNTGLSCSLADPILKQL